MLKGGFIRLRARGSSKNMQTPTQIKDFFSFRGIYLSIRPCQLVTAFAPFSHLPELAPVLPHLPKNLRPEDLTAVLPSGYRICRRIATAATVLISKASWSTWDLTLVSQPLLAAAGETVLDIVVSVNHPPSHSPPPHFSWLLAVGGRRREGGKG